MHTLKKTILASSAAALIAGTAFAQELPLIAEISSETDLAAVQNEEAAAYWANIDADLEGAVAARLIDRLGEEGLSIRIDIDEIELANAFESLIGLDLSLLSGHVRVSDPSRDLVVRDFQVTATAQQVIPLLPEGADITVRAAETPEFYDALVNAFADGVAQNIDD
jgi:hypothetical protein